MLLFRYIYLLDLGHYLFAFFRSAKVSTLRVTTRRACLVLAFSFLKKHQTIKSALQARLKFPLVLKPIKCLDNFII